MFCTSPWWYDDEDEYAVDESDRLGFYFTSIFKQGELTTKKFSTKQYDYFFGRIMTCVNPVPIGFSEGPGVKNHVHTLGNEPDMQ